MKANWTYVSHNWTMNARSGQSVVWLGHVTYYEMAVLFRIRLVMTWSVEGDRGIGGHDAG